MIGTSVMKDLMAKNVKLFWQKQFYHRFLTGLLIRVC